jgi:hypothetical protein
MADIRPPNWAALAGHLSRLMSVAASDLEIAGSCKLYGRFVGWMLPAGLSCRVCGKGGHDFLPGVPSRLVPCVDHPIEPIHRRTDGR